MASRPRKPHPPGACQGRVSRTGRHTQLFGAAASPLETLQVWPLHVASRYGTHLRRKGLPHRGDVQRRPGAVIAQHARRDRLGPRREAQRVARVEVAAGIRGHRSHQRHAAVPRDDGVQRLHASGASHRRVRQQAVAPSQPLQRSENQPFHSSAVHAVATNNQALARPRHSCESTTWNHHIICANSICALVHRSAPEATGFCGGRHQTTTVACMAAHATTKPRQLVAKLPGTRSWMCASAVVTCTRASSA